MTLLAYLVLLSIAAGLAHDALDAVAATPTADRVAAWLCAWTALACALLWPWRVLFVWGFSVDRALQVGEAGATLLLFGVTWLLGRAERQREAGRR